MTAAEAWAVLVDRIEGEDDLTDNECEAVDVLHQHFNEGSNS